MMPREIGPEYMATGSTPTHQSTPCSFFFFSNTTADTTSRPAPAALALPLLPPPLTSPNVTPPPSSPPPLTRRRLLPPSLLHVRREEPSPPQGNPNLNSILLPSLVRLGGRSGGVWGGRGGQREERVDLVDIQLFLRI